MAIMRDIMRGIMRDIMRGVVAGLGGIVRIFYAPLTSSLIPVTAIAKAYIFTRNDTDATVSDFEGLLKSVTANEARFVGARRVHNLATGLVTETITVINGNEYQVTIAGESGDLCIVSGAFTGILTADGINRISWDSGTPKTAGSTSVTLTVVGTLTEMLVEDVTGQANQNPSENVEIGAEHGSNVGNVKYFTYENGNTVNGSGIVAEANGAPIASAILEGILIEEARTNLLLRSREFNTLWTIQNLPATSEIGPSGVSEDCLLTDNSTNGSHRLFQSTALAATTQYTLSVYLKQGTHRYMGFRGSIAVGLYAWTNLDFTNLTIGNGTNVDSSNITLIGNGWYLFQMNFTTTTGGAAEANLFTFFPNSTIPSGGQTGVSYVGTGETVLASGMQLEEGVFASSRIPTEGSTASRNVEALSYSNTNFIDTEGTIALSFIPGGSTAQYTGGGDRSLVGVRNANDDVININSASGEIVLADGTNTTTAAAMPALVPYTIAKLAGRWSVLSSLMSIGQDGTEDEVAFDGSMNKSAALRIGYSGANRPNGSYKELSIYDGSVDDITFAGLQ